MAIAPINESLSTFNTALGTVKTNSAANLATLQTEIAALKTSEAVTTELDAVLAAILANNTLTQALTTPSLPNGISYPNTVLF